MISQLEYLLVFCFLYTAFSTEIYAIFVSFIFHSTKTLKKAPWCTNYDFHTRYQIYAPTKLRQFEYFFINSKTLNANTFCLLTKNLQQNKSKMLGKLSSRRMSNRWTINQNKYLDRPRPL